MLINLGKFVVLGGVILFVAWLAGTGRVAYVMVMLWIAAGLGYAVLDLVDYEIVKRDRRG
ncbi:MAG TPA: hypothetical protein VFM83_10965 [Gaiellaceae bacterium]|nr:hypothetical protein [Gaiellaceae bacterium]